nr:PREDICTED: transmembrane protein 65 isoform X1 [Latimeria chalumnae]|eukprot:XP_014346799.1 PREDICTED: transmembrane protein 65 isoform X1 [Latimeria chalumnae]
MSVILPCLRTALLRPALSLKPGAWTSWLPGGPVAWPSLRLLGTHPKKERVEPLNTAQGARDFIYGLHPSERSCLLRELHRFESIAIAQGQIGVLLPGTNSDSLKKTIFWKEIKEKLEPPPLTSEQQRKVFFHNAVPFIGFGFLDNAIMIAAGTQIELTIGVIFGISTMAAAALGNLVSDLAGLGLAGYVEAMASRLGLRIPDMTPKQADMWQTRLSSHLGKAIGVVIGCLLGMFPLLFFSAEEEEKLEGKN